MEELVDAGEFVGVVGGGCVLIASGLSGGLVFPPGWRGCCGDFDFLLGWRVLLREWVRMKAA